MTNKRTDTRASRDEAAVAYNARRETHTKTETQRGSRQGLWVR